MERSLGFADLDDRESVATQLLQSIAALAAMSFHAAAVSLSVHDASAQELVFVAVTRKEDGALVGRRFPAGAGVAGWSLLTGEPVIVANARQDQRFASDLAENTGYVPERLAAVPLLDEEGPLAVLEILDYDPALGDVEILELGEHFGRSAGLTLRLLRRSDALGAIGGLSGDLARGLGRMVDVCAEVQPHRQRSLARLLDAMSDFVSDASTSPQSPS